MVKLKTAIYSKNKKDRIRIKIFNISGDCCTKCFEFKGMVKFLELHHINPVTKIFSLSCVNFKSKKWEIVELETKKCLHLCPNCHRLYHLNYWTYKDLDLSKLKDFQVKLIEEHASK